MLNPEEKFIIDLLFGEKIIDKKRFVSINYEKLVKFASAHLILPTIYFKLKSKNYLNYVPKDFLEFISEIYKLNRERNLILNDEILFISKILKSNRIKHIFLKGSSYIKNNIFDDIGERMIGDIDFLVSENDIHLTAKVLEKNNYSTRIKYKYWKTSHIPKYVNPKKVFAIEPHIEVLSYPKRKVLDAKEIMNCNEPYNREVLQDISILNYQINDNGHLKASYSYRTIYDVFIISNNCKNFYKNNYIKRFYIITNYLGISSFNIKEGWGDKLFKLRFILKRKYKTLFLIDSLICEKLIFFRKIPKQLIEFIINYRYRKGVIKKLFK
tara:strand:+ start:4956 stop:5933 length:978 start_codon:yes stop_codon:yes gene_type:complete